MSNEFNVELERQLPGNSVVSVGYYRREQRRNIGAKNLLVPRESYTPLVVTEAVSGQQVTVYNQDPATRGRFDVLLDNFPELDRVFNGVDLTFNKRFSNRWMVISGLSVGKNIGDTYPFGDLNNPNFTFRRGLYLSLVTRAGGTFRFRSSCPGSMSCRTRSPSAETRNISRGSLSRIL